MTKTYSSFINKTIWYVYELLELQNSKLSILVEYIVFSSNYNQAMNVYSQAMTSLYFCLRRLYNRGIILSITLRFLSMLKNLCIYNIEYWNVGELIRNQIFLFNVQ